MAVLLAGRALHAQTSGRLAFVYTHQIEVNCESAVATQSGWIDLSNGTYGFDYVIKKFIPGYRWEVASPVTLATSSASPIAALEIGGAQNLFSLTGGALNYSVEVIMRDALVDLRTVIHVERQGDVIKADLHTRGKANLPDLIALESPLVMTQTPNPGGGFTERGVKVMIAEDGTRLESAFEAIYTGVNLPAPQVREVDVAFVDISPDRTCGRLNLASRVRPSAGAGPQLDIECVDDSTIRLRWQHPVPCVIEKAPSLYGPWAQSGLEVQCAGETCEAMDGVSGEPAYYRVRCEDGTYSRNVAGYVEVRYPAGLSLVSVPLPQANPALNAVLPLGDSGAGSLLYTYSDLGFRVFAYLGLGEGWVPEGTLQAGEGAFLLLSTPLAVKMVGAVPFGPNQLTLGRGLSLISPPVPLPGDGSLADAGFPAADGDIVYLWDGQRYVSSAYIEGFGWIPSPPAPPLGAGFWLLSASGEERVWTIPVPSPD
jgi:hypothetical protein